MGAIGQRAGVSEFHLLRHCLTVFVAQMRAGFHRERPAVLVTQPPRDGWNIRVGFNAAVGEQVAQILVGEAELWRPLAHRFCGLGE